MNTYLFLKIFFMPQKSLLPSTILRSSLLFPNLSKRNQESGYESEKNKRHEKRQSGMKG